MSLSLQIFTNILYSLNVQCQGELIASTEGQANIVLFITFECPQHTKQCFYQEKRTEFDIDFDQFDFDQSMQYMLQNQIQNTYIRQETCGIYQNQYDCQQNCKSCIFNEDQEEFSSQLTYKNDTYEGQLKKQQYYYCDDKIDQSPVINKPKANNFNVAVKYAKYVIFIIVVSFIILLGPLILLCRCQQHKKQKYKCFIEQLIVPIGE